MAIKPTKREGIDYETTITSIDPNDYIEITEEGFVKQYGKAAEKFIAKIESQFKSQIVEQILGIIKNNKLPYPNPYGKYIQVKRYNEVLLPKIKEEINKL